MRSICLFLLGVAATGLVLGVVFSLAAVWIASGVAALGLWVVVDA